MITYALKRFLKWRSSVVVLALLLNGFCEQGFGNVPLAHTPGAPTGSYALSDFEVVNLYNGHLNFALPLVLAAGRGKAQQRLMLRVDQHYWFTDYVPPDNEFGFPGGPYARNDEHPGKKGTFGVGGLRGETVYDEPCPLNANIAVYVLLRFYFQTPDGTQYEFRSQVSNGRPYQIACTTSGVNIGTTFVSADGTGTTFVSDVPFFYRRYPDPASHEPSGLVKFADGRQYRVDNGTLSWVRDSNGNKTSFTYDSSVLPDYPLRKLTSITDSLNRRVSICYANTAACSNAPYDQITYEGFGGADRTIKIRYDLLSNLLRPGLANIPYIFPEFDLSEGPYNPAKVASIEIPDGRRYKLYYNPYGELARVELPTGGAYEYDHTPGSGVIQTDPYYQKINRRMVNRRVYPSGGTGDSYELETVYEATVDTTTTPHTSIITERNYNSLELGRLLISATKHYYHGDPRASLVQGPVSYSSWIEGREYKTEELDLVTGLARRRVEQRWEQRAPISWWAPPYCFGAACGSHQAPANDPRVVESVTTLCDTNHVTKSTAVNPQTGTAAFDQFNNQTDLWEYDFDIGSPGGLLRHTHTNYLTVANGIDYTDQNGVHIRNLPTQTSVYDAGGVERSRSAVEYDNYATDTGHAALVNRSGISGFDSAFNTGYPMRGNATAVTQYLLTNGTVTGSVSNYAQYDIAGNVVMAIDGRGFATTLDFTDCFGGPDGNARLNSQPIELSSVGQVGYAVVTSMTNPLGHTSFSQVDYYTGRPVDEEDINGVVSSGYSDSDQLDRPTKIIRAVNTSARNQTVFAYDDTNRMVTTSSDLNSFVDPFPLKSQVLYDGLGRTIETRQYEDATKYIAAQTQYDALGRSHQTSNPFRPLAPDNQTPVWTKTRFDGLGRVTRVTTPDNAVVTTSYSGNTVTVQDQAGKQRKSVTDALGRLKAVYEAPDDPSYNYLTSYSYDTLDNLTAVSQGNQSRTFAYDSRKRQTSATNPESGTICYGTVIAGQCLANGYDANGNLIHKTDARGVLSTYSYDALNRNTSVVYTNDPDATPSITRIYDLAATGKGRLYQSQTAASGLTTISSYDALGRPTYQHQQFYAGGFWSESYITRRSYNLAGAVTSQTYPSNRTVAYVYDNAGRTTSFSGNLGDDARTYSSGMVYSPTGGMAKEQFGTNTPVYNKHFYNSRGQLAEIRASTSYTGPTDTNSNRGALLNQYSLQCTGICNATDNNGNLRKQEVWIPHNDDGIPSTSWYQQFDYDALNRLKRVHEYTGNTASDWQQEYDYDPWGNRTIDQNNTSGAGINEKQFSITAVNGVVNNRLGVPPGEVGTMRYDDAGNLIEDTYSASAVLRVYDAENRMTSEKRANEYLAGVYTYNADGQRVRRQVDGTSTWQIYGMDGELLAEYPAGGSSGNPQKEYGYRNGELLVTAEPGTSTDLINVAASSNGGTATALNYTQDGVYPGLHFQPAYANDGVRYVSTNEDHYWRDEHGLASWVEIAFNGSKTIEEVDVYTIANYPAYLTQADPSATQTFTSYGATSFEVQYWTGNSWATVSGGAITGNNLVWRKINFAPTTTTKIRVRVTGAVDGVARIVEVEAWGTAAAALLTNVAATANGGTATALNYTQDGVYPGLHFQPAYANDGVRYVASSEDRYWRDEHGLASWVEIAFNGSKTIEEVDVYTIADYPAYLTQADPSSTQTFTSYGATSFEVQYWTGSSWVTVNGGAISGNNLVWTKVNFAALTTTKIRVRVTGAVDGVARIAEVEAWTENSGWTNDNLQWLIADQLGTPRMILDKTGSLAGVKRHDYLPFGEELLVGQGLRTSGQNGLGYSGDNIRQKFTSKERDNETGLDYFGARYYSSSQGRFTSIDPENYQAMLDLTDPQSWNAYSYTNNNPLGRVDPDGKGWWDRVKNWFRYGHSVENDQLAKLEQERREWLNQHYYESDPQGNWRPFDSSQLSTQDVFDKYKEVKFFYEEGQLHRLTDNEVLEAWNRAPIVGARDPSAPVRKLAEPRFKTDGEAAKKARELGFTKTSERVHGQAVFKKGKTYITRDVDGHNGGAWKVANSVKDLTGKATRSGTYDENLKRIAN